MAKRILLIEGEKSLSRLVSLKLQEKGYQAFVSQNGHSGLKMALERDFELIFIDFNLPDQDGLKLMQEIKKVKKVSTVLMVNREDVENLPKTEGLANDYLVKPFAVEELLDKVDEIFQRKGLKRKPPKSNQTAYQDLIMDEASRSVIRRGEAIALTKREFALLSTLLRHINTVMTREELLDYVWSYNDGTVETNVVDVYVRYLRGKIDIPGHESYIQTVRGLGYVIREH
ncbi:response regulator [Streptococcus criceti]|uniref:DNA-binding response regulator CsrR n=1 Tax=Streptococcus criceti HS-6 TaxID=873449 RepID=G5JST6_STRCG|nr:MULTISPECIES: response regulator transcription factor [Streptococcus]EHI74547.1 DNA-binding response regulator CsrR [Streptococcus criceti HS-6]SUN37563.1 response regulator [Streptococcus criceti]